MWLQGEQLSGKRRPSSLEGFLFLDSQIDRLTIQAYLETGYHVHGDAPATLRVGTFCSGLAELHQAHRVDCSAFITACNPYSQVLSERFNTDSQNVLAGELERRALPYIGGMGQHPSNQWLGEASFLVLGLALDAAKTLGVQFEQNAIVWSGSDAVPQLILLR